MKEYRCVKCHKLLGKITRKTCELSHLDGIKKDRYSDDVSIEIKCSKCGKVNTLTVDARKELEKVNLTL